MALPPGAVTPDTLVTLKVTFKDAAKKIKLPLKDLTATTLPDKLRTALNIPSDKKVSFERYSDSAGGYIVLDQKNVPVYKALVRAAKAKGKLRLKATIEEEQDTTPAMPDYLQCTKPRLSGGIFDYRAANPRLSSCLKTDAAPQEKNLAFRPRETAQPVVVETAWSVYCNACDAALPDVHYHCSVCDGGDYDLCETCVAGGALCLGEDHWLIKRFIRDGKVVTSVTERIGRKPQPEMKSMPGSFDAEVKPANFTAPAVAKTSPEATRTCNSCVVVLAERDFVTCKDCEDYDLCVPCHGLALHGHSAKHSFEPATKDTILSVHAQSLLKAGRNVAHNAICDGCDKKIFGIRHKCLNCPDFDYCNDCHASAGQTHARHRFAPIYEQLADPAPTLVRHFGIYCDGPLCRAQGNQSYITGNRYKCAVCNDTDFCANCEASPHLTHNRTHPLIKFKTAVRNVSITTTNEDNHGNVRNLGDRRQPAPVQPTNASIAVQTVAEIPPTEVVVQPKDCDIPASPVTKSSPVSSTMLTAAFVRDSVPDGTVMLPGAVFTQIWTLRNEGPFSWPAGCSVRFVGGDNMLNVDNFHPASVSAIAKATESSVVAREVQIGEEISFRITLRAPVRQGKSISYWRLKAADGTPFGHRLWCDIDVRSSAPDGGEKVISAPTQPSYAPARRVQEAASRQQSRIQAMRDTQLRLLENQRMLQHARLPRTEQRSFTAPTYSWQAPVVDAEVRNEAAPAYSWQTPVATNAEKVRKEAAKARVETIKAKIMRYRAENEKLHAKMRQNATAPVEASEPAKLPEPASIELPTVEQSIKKEETDASSTTSSQMVFPKLEKESPASSIIAARPAFVQTEDGEVEQSAALPAEAEPATSPLIEDLDDLEVVSIVSDDSEDDGFLTDEEYDILDASDRETVASP